MTLDLPAPSCMTHDTRPARRMTLPTLDHPAGSSAAHSSAICGVCVVIPAACTAAARPSVGPSVIRPPGRVSCVMRPRSSVMRHAQHEAARSVAAGAGRLALLPAPQAGVGQRVEGGLGSLGGGILAAVGPLQVAHGDGAAPRLDYLDQP